MRTKLVASLAALVIAPAAFTDVWSVSYNGSIMQINYGSGSNSPQYAAIHLDSSYLRMNYGPPSGWGTSIVVMPSYWSGNQYFQGYASSESHQLVGANLVVSLRGVSHSLVTNETITFYPPASGLFCATVQATTSGSVTLDNRPGEAFKPLMFSSMHESATSWDASAPYVGTTQYSFPGGGWIISPSQQVWDDRFGLLGGTSAWKPNAPAVDIKFPAPMQVCGWLNTDNNPNDDNVGYWTASSTVLSSWTYDILASNATAPPERISGTVTLGNYPQNLVTGKPITVEIRSPGTTTPLDTETALLDSAGGYTFTTPLPPGTYDIAVKASHWLRRVLSNQNLPATGLTGLNYSLINGDITGDNLISLGDFANLRAAYGSSSGSTNWNANADLDGSGTVGLGDFAILRGNYGLQGDP